MMNLHNDKNLFKEIIREASTELAITQSLIEKDYYVTMILKEYHKLEPNIVFKGGTSLSKAYHIIKRFSEDIDINYKVHDKLNNRKHKEIKYNLIDAVEKCGLKISNLENTRSRRTFNRYIVPYNPMTDNTISTVNSTVIVETAFQEQSYPIEIKHIQSIIGEYLANKGLQNIIDKYELNGFDMYVQKYDRTLIDKIFALADYYISGRIKAHSRHLYDIYKISELVDINDDFIKLFDEVKLERSKLEICPSSKENTDLFELIDRLIEEETYKEDYKTVTSPLLLDEISYDECIDRLIEVTDKIKKYINLNSN
ncbi:MAG: nucleotidyl transferase AbiEii/AbiGii toxin family protein [Erysipelotrichaceae bacterium]|nr:nucleotidyl transferase AbiEii/AbiGii toxin family protein [Erysipelotrichaceae bacterium]